MSETPAPRPDVSVEWVIIDCADLDLVCEFWTRLLGVGVKSRRGPYIFLERSSDSGAHIGLQKVGEPKEGKNRVHLDLITDDVAGLARRVDELGGGRVPGYESGGFLVMADPEGNEFCILPPDFDMDEHGNVTYLDDVEL